MVRDGSEGETGGEAVGEVCVEGECGGEEGK